MHAYPVHYQIDRPETFTRLQLALRVISFADASSPVPEAQAVRQ